MTSTTPAVPHRALTVLLTVVLPLLFTAGAFGWVASFAAELPDPVAVHWSFDGRPDGFGSWQSSLAPLAAVTLAMCGMAAAIGVGLGRAAATRRLAVFLGLWSGVALPWMVAGSLHLQRGLSDASLAANADQPMWLSFGAATLIGGVAAALIPGDARLPTRDQVPADAARLTLADTEVASWRRTAQITGFWWVAIGGGLLTLALAGFGARQGAFGAQLTAWITGLVTALLVALGRWQVVVDHTGLTVRPLISRPRTRVPLDEVVSAEVTAVSPLKDFGGWGYRVGSEGRVGVVVRTGEAICVHQTGGRALVVTVDDAATGAALLNTLADRARRR